MLMLILLVACALFGIYVAAYDTRKRMSFVERAMFVAVVLFMFVIANAIAMTIVFK